MDFGTPPALRTTPAPHLGDSLASDPDVDARARGFTLNRAAALGVLLAVILFWGAALYGIRSPFYYGHYGYHGGSYATWARGTLRHHTLLPVNEPGFAPPRPGSYYIHHPVLTHQLVTLTFSLFGEHEWSIRLAALIPAFASLLLVAAIAWRNLGPLAGALAALVFALVPVNIWYSVNIDQGFPSIACLLAFFWFYLDWLKTGRWSRGAAALIFQALAGGFEWSPYFAFPAVFAHVAWTAAQRRGRYLSFALLHPLVVLIPIGAHIFVVWKSGMMSDLLGAYRTRAAEVSYRHFVEVMGQYGETLFGRTLLAVMSVWLLLTVGRLVVGRGRAVDLVGLTFAFALVVYVHVFKNAVITHAYRQLYGNVWAAMAAADLATRLGRWAQRLAWRRYARRATTAPTRAIGIGAACALGLGVLATTAPIAWAGLMESRAHGGIPGWKTFDPDLRQTAFARELLRQTRPEDTVYVHPSFASPPPYRMDWAFYYDRDLKRGSLMRLMQVLSPDQKKHAVAILASANLTYDERRAYAELAVQHPTLIIDDLVMLDLRTDGPDRRAYSLVPAKLIQKGRLARWLDGPYGAPHLQPDPGRRLAEEQLVRSTLALPATLPNLPRGMYGSTGFAPPASAGARSAPTTAGGSAATAASAAAAAAAAAAKVAPPKPPASKKHHHRPRTRQQPRQTSNASSRTTR